MYNPVVLTIPAAMHHEDDELQMPLVGVPHAANSSFLRALA